MALTFQFYIAVMADRKEKPVTPIKTLTKKEQQDLKKKVRSLGYYETGYNLVLLKRIKWHTVFF